MQKELATSYKIIIERMISGEAGNFDRRLLVTGSYNWTRSAARNNLENIAITDDPRLVEPYRDEFERLWERFAIRG